VSENALAAFLNARIDEAAAAAWAVHDVSKCEALLYEEDMADAAARTPDCDCGHPARVLRDAGADRKLIAAYEAARAAIPSGVDWDEVTDGVTVGIADGLEAAVKIRAERFSGHPGYRQEWVPG